MSWVSTVFHDVEDLLIVYVLAINTVYFLLMLIGYFALRKNHHQFTPKELDLLLKSPLVPSVSVLTPAYCESATIAESVRSMLRLRHPKLEVIVINDGSSDDTLAVLIKEFRLYRSSRVPMGEITTSAVRAVYESQDSVPLIVIDKANGGKADALNCGINYARHDLFAALDADSIIERDALLQISRPFLERPEETVAVGGIVRVANGCTVEHGSITQIRVPNKWLAQFQVIEYLRAFLGGRVAFSHANALLIISGAFGLFRREAVVALGGYRTDTVGEDMELVIRLHRTRREQNLPCRVEFVANPVCWTEVPEDWRTLRRQRMRWQRGCLECLSLHRDLIANSRFGAVGWIGMVYAFACEVCGPVIELLGYLTTIVGLLFGWITPTHAFLFAVVSILFGLLLSIASLILEELTMRKYPDVRDILRLILAGLFENFGYRQMTMIWRVEAIFSAVLKKKASWGRMERRGFSKADA